MDWKWIVSAQQARENNACPDFRRTTSETDEPESPVTHTRVQNEVLSYVTYLHCSRYAIYLLGPLWNSGFETSRIGCHDMLEAYSVWVHVIFIDIGFFSSDLTTCYESNGNGV
jgi:hypothetical protein